MAISATITRADGLPGGPAMIVLDMDGTTSFASGSTLGATVVSQLGGSDVDASTAELYTSAAAQAPDVFVAAAAASLEGDMTGVSVTWTQNTTNEYVLQFTPKVGVADDLDISTAVFTSA